MSDPLGDSPAPSFDDPLGMLRACHGRIERQLATLQRLQRHLPENGADAQARSAARALLRYFDHAEPNHHADEEASVFPRLLARAPSARDLVARLKDEHRAPEPQLAQAAAAARRHRQRTAREPVACIGAIRCDASYDEHLAIEDGALLPMCAERLTHEELAAIGAEMAARRKSGADT